MVYKITREALTAALQDQQVVAQFSASRLVGKQVVTGFDLVAWLDKYHVSHNLSHIDFTGLGRALRGANMQHLSLEGANLGGLDLTHANLQGAILLHTSFRNSCLKHVNFEKAVIWKTDFAGADVTDANLEGIFLLESDLKNANGVSQEQIALTRNFEPVFPEPHPILLDHQQELLLAEAA